MRRIRKLATIIVVLALAGCSRCGRHRQPTVREGSASASRAPAQSTAKRRTPRPESIESARTIRASFEQLPPDNRFLLALRSLPSLAGASSPAHVRVEWMAGQWQVSADGTHVAALGETVDFPELQAILIAQARAMARSKVGVDKSAGKVAPSPLLFDAELETEMGLVNGLWSKGWSSAPIATRAAHAAVSLAVETNDETGVGDAFLARAWALQALARGVGGGWESDEALLAQALGYTRSARTLSDRLPAGSSTRLFLQRDDDGLQRLAAGASVDKSTAFFRILRLAQLGDAGQLTAFADRTHAANSRGLASAILQQNSFEAYGGWAMTAALLELQTNERRARMPVSASAAALQGRALSHFDDVTDALMERVAQPFDGEVLRSAARASFYSALEKELLWHAQMRGLPREGEATLTWLGKANGISGEVKRWLREVSGLSGHYELDDFDEAMSKEWPSLGAPAYVAIIDRQFRSETAGSAGQLEGARYALRRLDARPEHLRLYSKLAAEVLEDNDASVRFGRRLLQLGDGPWLEAWIANWDGDATAFERLATDQAAPAAARYRAVLKLLKEQRITIDEASERLKAIVASGQNMNVWHDYSYWLRQNERWPDILALDGPWLASHPDDHSMLASRLRVDQARALWQTGRAADAWTVLQPAIEMGSRAELREAAFVQLALGDKAAAEQWESQLVDRYGSNLPAIFIDRASIQWRVGDPAKAAEMLAEVSGFHWREPVARAFRETFGRKLTDPAKAALDAIIPKAPSEWLPLLVEGFQEQEAPELAVYVIEKLPPVEYAEFDVQAYGVLKAARGEQAALEWLKKRDHTKVQMLVSQAAYRYGYDELLFSLVDPDTAEHQRELMWLHRVQSVVRRGLTSGPQYDVVRAHYAREGVPEAEWSMPAGRYLLGLGEDPILHQSKNAMTFLTLQGLKADGAGDLVTADALYRDALEFDAASDSGGWGLQKIQEWSDRSIPLTRIAAERKARP